jgi:manganese/iron transport system ATP-binding protein/manganese/zinc/iron transport system ATP- binding protein
VLLARALVQDARVLLLDEPFSGLDTRSTELVMGLLDELAAEGRAILIATHDVDQARAWDLVLCVNGVQVAFGPPDTTLTIPTLERTYGGAIVELPGGHGHAVLPPHHHDH